MTMKFAQFMPAARCAAAAAVVAAMLTGAASAQAPTPPTTDQSPAAPPVVTPPAGPAPPPAVAPPAPPPAAAAEPSKPSAGAVQPPAAIPSAPPPPTVAQPPAVLPPTTNMPGVPAPGPLPPAALGPPMTAPPPSAVQLIAPLDGQWQGAGTESGVATRQWLTLNADGTFVNYTQYSVGQTGFVIQSWGRYSVFATQPQTGFLTVDIQGFQPQQLCSSVGCQPVQMAPQANIQFTLINANTMRTQIGTNQSNLVRVQAVQTTPPAAAPRGK